MEKPAYGGLHAVERLAKGETFKYRADDIFTGVADAAFQSFPRAADRIEICLLLRVTCGQHFVDGLHLLGLSGGIAQSWDHPLEAQHVTFHRQRDGLCRLAPLKVERRQRLHSTRSLAHLIRRDAHRRQHRDIGLNRFVARSGLVLYSACEVFHPPSKLICILPGTPQCRVKHDVSALSLKRLVYPPAHAVDGPGNQLAGEIADRDAKRNRASGHFLYDAACKVFRADRHAYIVFTRHFLRLPFQALRRTPDTHHNPCSCRVSQYQPLHRPSPFDV